MKQPALTLYYDGRCPFCRTEMIRLGHWDRHGRLDFVDIAKAGFDPAPLGASMADLNREMHSRTAEGKVLVGTASILAAYTLVGHGWLVLPLRVPGLRTLLSGLYRQFARHRYSISRWFGYGTAPVCSNGTCYRERP